MTECILLLDSGIGGLTVFRSLLKKFPEENFVYFADRAYLPYGKKSPEALFLRVQKILAFVQRRHKVKALVLACHTLSVCCLEPLQKAALFPVFGMQIDFTQFARYQKVALLATERTIASGVYQSAFSLVFPQKTLLAKACPSLAGAIEAHLLQEEKLLPFVHLYLAPLLEHGVEAAIFACTHYPLLLPLVQKSPYSQISFFDCGDMIAERVSKLPLKKEGEGFRQLYVTEDPLCFKSCVEKILGDDYNPVSVPGEL